MDYFRDMLPLIRPHFSALMMEVQPMAQKDYAELKRLGLDGVMVYQETYHPVTYQQHHLRGNKKDFYWRLETLDSLGMSGIDKIGIGALIGLSHSWCTDCYIWWRSICCICSKPTGKVIIPYPFRVCGPMRGGDHTRFDHG